VAKIGAVVRDASRQSALRQYLAGRAPLFSAERFCTELRALVREFGAGSTESDRRVGQSPGSPEFVCDRVD